MVKKNILLINDVAGYGKVATAAMLPVLSYMGHPTYNIPTALVSNTLDYGKFKILETTGYIESVFPVWRELGFRFDAIATGFMVSARQAGIVSKYCIEQACNGTLVFVDPIMGDEGKLYNGVTEAAVGIMREMAGVADLICPNYTEACYLAGEEFHAEGVSVCDANRLVNALRKVCHKSVVVTSIKIDGSPSVAGYNHLDGSFFVLPYNEIPVHFPGTGDVFSAVLFGHLLDGDPLVPSVQKAMDAVYRLIDLNRGNEDKNCGIPVENYLYVI